MNNNIEQSNAHCKSCDSDFVYTPDMTWFDEHGYGYSTKLTKCPFCKKIVVVKYYEDSWFDVNNDERFYE